MSVRTCRDGAVLARWKAKTHDRGLRTCLLLQWEGRGGPVLAVWEPADSETDLEILPQAALVDGIRLLLQEVALARRVIETGRAEREAWQKSVQIAGVELEAMSDHSGAYGRALVEFERRYGRGYPYTEELSR